MIFPFGDAAVLVELEQRMDPALVARAAAIADAWERAGHGPAIPAYASAVLRFDPGILAPDEALVVADALMRGVARAEPPPGGREVVIPVRYDGPDLDDVAERSGLSADALVEAHLARAVTAYFVGFMPGFAYCGPIDPRIVAPRLERPRPRVPAGSVAVADGQTGVYPTDSPGGWRLIGRTDLRVFDASRERPALIAAGDSVRFVRA